MNPSIGAILVAGVLQWGMLGVLAGTVVRSLRG